MSANAQLHLVCNAHLDPCWQWEWEEGAAAAVSTFRTAADCCDLSEGLIFCHNEALLYQWVEQFEPVLFERIRRLVKAGRWHIMGGWQIQPDCNMPSGESFVRQMLIGRSWFREKFGVDPRTAINFDSFGHTRGLVQLLRKAGYDSYIITRPKQNDCPVPADDFTWVGYDGSEVTVKRCIGYGSPLGKAVEAVQPVAEATSKDGTVQLKLWGVGNHGGGPSKQDVKDLDAYIAETRGVAICHSTPEGYFAALRESGRLLSRHEGDLNAWAVGCYTSQVRIKQKHRQLEGELFATEKMLAVAAMQELMSYPAKDLLEVMRDLAFAEFHDTLPGTSIQNVEDAAIRLMDHGMEILSRHKAQAFFALASGQPPAVDGEIPVLVYNPHPWPVRGVFECEFMLADQNWKDEFTIAKVWRDGVELPTQIEKELSNLTMDWRKRVVFVAELKPGQMNRFDCKLEITPARPKPQLQAKDGSLSFDNGVMQVEINTTTGLLDRYAVNGVDLLKPGACRLLVITDDEDPWGMKVQDFRRVEGAFALMSREEGSRFSGLRPGTLLDSVRVIEEGSARTVVEALFRFGDSFAVQTIKMPRQGAELEIHVRIYWNEKNKMLKWSVPTALAGERCLGQVACGQGSLPVTGKELVAQQWLMVTDEARSLGLSVINDGIYGSDCQAGELRMSLLRSPAYCGHPISDDRPIVPQDRFLPRIDQGERTYVFRLQGGALGERLVAVDSEALLLNQKPMALSFFPAGGGTSLHSGPVLSDPVVQLQALKQADNGDGWIVRIFNPTSAPRVSDFSLPSLGIKQKVSFGPFELKTLRVSSDGQKVRETDLLERFL